MAISFVTLPQPYRMQFNHPYMWSEVRITNSLNSKTTQWLITMQPIPIYFYYFAAAYASRIISLLIPINECPQIFPLKYSLPFKVSVIKSESVIHHWNGMGREWWYQAQVTRQLSSIHGYQSQLFRASIVFTVVDNTH